MINRGIRLIKKTAGRAAGESGMTLVETLVAIAILSISVTAFILALSTGAIATRTYDEKALAQGLAQTQMETIKAAAYDATGISYAIISPPAEYGITIRISPVPGGNNNIQKVTVAVSHGADTVFNLEGYKADRG
jgi:prepilin-type N-terminal cleavage/methylation domain-containing protein